MACLCVCVCVCVCSVSECRYAVLAGSVSFCLRDMSDKRMCLSVCVLAVSVDAESECMHNCLVVSMFGCEACVCM